MKHQISRYQSVSLAKNPFFHYCHTTIALSPHRHSNKGRVGIIKPTSLQTSTLLNAAFNIKLLPSHEMLVDFAYIGIGAVTGACARYQIGNIVNRKISEAHHRFAYYSGWHTAGE